MDKKNTKLLLVLSNTVLVLFLIILFNFKVLPLQIGDFAFFTFLFFLFALYRPSWTFLFFIGTIPLENIYLAPESLGIAVRPYQFFAAITILALIVRFFLKKPNFTLPKWHWYDLLPIFLGIGGILSLINASEISAGFKQVIILFSFVVIYFLTRIYIQILDDLRKIIPFFISSSLVVIFYGIWQNIRFLADLSNFEAMPGRPNATFTEPEWLGSFLAICITSALVLIFHFFKSKEAKIKFYHSFPFLLLVSYFIIAILTVSRSAWLAVFSAVIIFLLLSFTAKIIDFKSFVKFKLSVVLCFLLALAAVYAFHLTNFQLFNRAQSTASGLQKITIACEQEIVLPESIANTEELASFNCRHINLEDIEKEKSAGKIVTEIYRQDPNVNTRKIIYQKTWQEIKNHPVLGVGWGSIGKILGADERGASLNASNIFLEIWLGSGLIGLLCFIIFLGNILLKTAKAFISTQDFDAKIFSVFILSTLFGFIVFNLFNSGILLAFFWVFLGIALIKTYEDRH